MAPDLDHSKLNKHDFDAIVTGELTHHSIWLEDAVAKFISDFFVLPELREVFNQLVLQRDGMSFQMKIEIVESLIPFFEDENAAKELRAALRDVRDFKTTRNAFAHGRDVTPSDLSSPALHIQTFGRTGKERISIVTPESHKKLTDDASKLLDRIEKLRARIVEGEARRTNEILADLAKLFLQPRDKSGEPTASPPTD